MVNDNHLILLPGEALGENGVQTSADVPGFVECGYDYGENWGHCFKFSHNPSIINPHKKTL